MKPHVLVAIDRSPEAQKALEFALDQFPDAELTVLHVLNPSDLFAYWADADDAVINVEEMVAERRKHGQKLLTEAEATVADRDRAITTVLESGRPARTIVQFAEENDIDHIIIGSTGRTGTSRLLLGSVAELVARRAPVPVTIVR